MGLVNKKAGHNRPTSNHWSFRFSHRIAKSVTRKPFLLQANKSAYQTAHPQSDPRIEYGSNFVVVDVDENIFIRVDN